MKRVLVILLLVFVTACGSQMPREPEPEIPVLNEVNTMKLTSPEFENEGRIPSEYTCDGSDTSPELNIADIPESTKSLVLICDDPDAPAGTWDHWIVFNIAPTTSKIAKGAEPQGTAGKNSWGKAGYGGPCPPSGTHRYFFKLYALDTELDLPEGSAKADIEKAMQGHILEQAQLMGKYQRS
jgi:Raf kinase inhibitor-like YbhB/YbcL family protein